MECYKSGVLSPNLLDSVLKVKTRMLSRSRVAGSVSIAYPCDRVMDCVRDWETQPSITQYGKHTTKPRKRVRFKIQIILLNAYYFGMTIKLNNHNLGVVCTLK